MNTYNIVRCLVLFPTLNIGIILLYYCKNVTIFVCYRRGYNIFLTYGHDEIPQGPVHVCDSLSDYGGRGFS